MERRLWILWTLAWTLALGGGGVACKDSKPDYITFDAGPANDAKADLGPTDSAGDHAGEAGADAPPDGPAHDATATDTVADGTASLDALADGNDDATLQDAENGQ
jgi:hypothetical protein